MKGAVMCVLGQDCDSSRFTEQDGLQECFDTVALCNYWESSCCSIPLQWLMFFLLHACKLGLFQQATVSVVDAGIQKRSMHVGVILPRKAAKVRDAAPLVCVA